MPGSAVSDLAGRVLAGRYLLHGAIGTGASGRVYLADDTRLRRRVAVKVLHVALADDAAFLRRFRAEAQLAASLRHSNIVTVYDWGEDDVPFMVLELLAGGSLRTMLDQGTLLTLAQAARVGRDVASALEYAHARDVLHRDVKPANLLFDEHGIVRVADFGLARALAEASWTEPVGGVLGTARYASPEQAVGSQLDARSDLYALALVLVEAVTGRVPFAADTTIGMLTARTQRPLIAPESLGPLAAVIDRAGRLQPGDRYPDAGTMRQALSDAADALPPPGALVLAGMVDRADPHPTRVVAPTLPALYDQDAVAITPDPPAPKRRRPTGQRRLVPFVVGAVLVATVAVAASAFARVGGASPVSVPGLVGRTAAAARVAAERGGLTVSVSRQAAPDPVGVVIGQSPGPGSWMTSRRVRLVVSSGPALVSVPPIKGQPWSSVQKQLDGIGFAYGKPTRQYDETHSADAVLSVKPDVGTRVAPDASLVIVLSRGHAPVKVPDVSKQSLDAASQALGAAHFQVKHGADENSDTIPAGQVISTSPASDAPAPYGSAVTVVVSKGPVMVRVPDVRNLTLAEAIARLGDAGLAFATSGHARPGDVVATQSPSPKTSVPKNSTTVTLSFTKGSRSGG